VNDNYVLAIIAAILLSRRESVTNIEKEIAIADAFDLTHLAQVRLDNRAKLRAKVFRKKARRLA
jgi:hypothetical protein